MGFPAALKSITREIREQAGEVTDRVRKGRAALNMLQRWLKENADGVTAEELCDVEDMVELTLEALPHHYQDVNDPFDEMEMRARRAIEAWTQWQRRTEVALEALTVATWPNASVAELNRQAQQLAGAVDGHESLVEAWESFKRLLAPRSLVVVVERDAAGVISGVSVLNEASHREYRRLRKACAAQVSALARFETTLEASYAG